MRSTYFCLLVLLSGCGTSEINTTSYQNIINGETCSEEVFPASLQLIKLTGQDYSALCGATLVAPDVVVTAAHCVKNVQPDDQYFVSSKSDLEKLYDSEFTTASPKTLPVRMIVRHGGYDGVKGAGPHHDIALLFLARKSSLQPVQMMSPLEAQLMSPGLKAYIVGWGQQQIGLKDEVNSAPIKHCATTFLNKITSYEMQLGSGKHSPHKCFGDSGGASYIQLGSGLRFAGITSHGRHDDSVCKHGGFDTRVDVYDDWIQKQMQEGCEKGYRLFCP
jgi:secreted trypsin-like serine protease